MFPNCSIILHTAISVEIYILSKKSCKQTQKKILDNHKKLTYGNNSNILTERNGTERN